MRISAVVLAAGEGAGAWPFCGIRQKVTVPIANVPMVRRLILALKRCGVEDVAVVTGHRGEAVRACAADIEGVSFIEQRALKGPVDAALLGIQSVTGERTVIAAADIVTTTESIQNLLHAGDSGAALLTAPCPDDIPHYTSIEAGTDGQVLGVWGHGGRDHPRYGGVAIAPTDLLRRYLLRNPGIMDNVHIGAMPSCEGDIAHSFELMRRDGVEVRAVLARGFLVDVDRPWQIMEANYAAAAHDIEQAPGSILGEGASVHDGADIVPGAKLILAPAASIGPGVHIKGSAVLGPGARVENGAILGPGVTIGAGTICRDYCFVDGGSVAGNGCLFAHGSEFSGVAFNTVWLYHYCCITGLIGDNVDIGAATVCGTWRFDEGTRTQTVKGHKETPANFGDSTFIGDYCRTGVNVMFMPGVKVGYYSCVGAGAIVYDDVPERTLCIPKQEHILKPWGPEKYGW